MIIDAHAHYLLPAWTDILWTPTMRASTQWPRIVLRSHLLYDPHILIAAANMRGITHSVCMPEISAPPGPHIHGGRLAMLDIVRQMNDTTAKLMNRNPEQITGIAVAVPDAAPAMLAELHRSVLLLGLKGIVIAASTPGVQLEDPSLEPFFATIASYQVPLIIHPSITPHSSSGRDFGMDLFHNYPMSLASALLKFIVSGRFKAHPNLTIIAPHGGGGLLNMLGWIQSTNDLPMDIAAEFRRIHIDTAGLTAQEIHLAQSIVGNGHVLYGTDWPMLAANAHATTHSDTVIHAATRMESEREHILFGNAQQIFTIAQG